MEEWIFQAESPSFSYLVIVVESICSGDIWTGLSITSEQFLQRSPLKLYPECQDYDMEITLIRGGQVY